LADLASSSAPSDEPKKEALEVVIEAESLLVSFGPDGKPSPLKRLPKIEDEESGEMVHDSDVEVLQNDKSLTLPDSIAEKKPDQTLVVMVNQESILVGGRKVADLSSVLQSKSSDIAGLKEELDYLAARKPYKDEEAEKLGRDVNIMADKDTPYSLLKKVMATCAKAEYRNISLAVSQVENKAEPIVVGDGSVGE